jgi:hypothetical protein
MLSLIHYVYERVRNIIFGSRRRDKLLEAFRGLFLLRPSNLWHSINSFTINFPNPSHPPLAFILSLDGLQCKRRSRTTWRIPSLSLFWLQYVIHCLSDPAKGCTELVACLRISQNEKRSKRLLREDVAEIISTPKGGMHSISVGHRSVLRADILISHSTYSTANRSQTFSYKMGVVSPSCWYWNGADVEPIISLHLIPRLTNAWRIGSTHLIWFSDAVLCFRHTSSVYLEITTVNCKCSIREIRVFAPV